MGRTSHHCRHVRKQRLPASSDPSSIMASDCRCTGQVVSSHSIDDVSKAPVVREKIVVLRQARAEKWPSWTDRRARRIDVAARRVIGGLICVACLVTVACSGARQPPSVVTGTVRTTSDTMLAPELVSSWSAQRDFFIARGFTILEWEAAQGLLLRKTYRGGKMYHTGWVTIYTRDGGDYLTKEPQTDAFLSFMRERRLPMEGFAPE